MLAKAVLILCAQTLLVQIVFSYCAGGAGYGLGGYNGMACGYNAGLSGGYGSGYGCGASGVASSGGGFPVFSVSPFAPTGISVVSENVLEGELIASGNLPFLAAVALEGVVPSGGNGAVSYGCGDGVIGMGNEAPIYTGMVTPGAMFPPTSPSPATYNVVDGLTLRDNAGYNGFGGVSGCGFGGTSGCGRGVVAGNRGLGCGCARY